MYFRCGLRDPLTEQHTDILVRAGDRQASHQLAHDGLLYHVLPLEAYAKASERALLLLLSGPRPDVFPVELGSPRVDQQSDGVLRQAVLRNHTRTVWIALLVRNITKSIVQAEGLPSRARSTLDPKRLIYPNPSRQARPQNGSPRNHDPSRSVGPDGHRSRTR